MTPTQLSDTNPNSLLQGISQGSFLKKYLRLGPDPASTGVRTAFADAKLRFRAGRRSAYARGFGVTHANGGIRGSRELYRRGCS
jgi:hypothetical protein